MHAGGTPLLVLKEGTERESGKNARKGNINAALGVSDAVRSTLGPKGMDKMLVDSLGDVVITNDGVTILKELDIEHPAAKMVVEVAKTQDQECGDGTTTAVVLAGELLKKAEDLIDANVHPTVIAMGYSKAAEKALDVLEQVSHKVTAKDDKVLKNIASTSITGKNAGYMKDVLADLAVKAVKGVSDTSSGKVKIDLNNVKVEKKMGGTVENTQLIQGIVMDKERVHKRMPLDVGEAKIALINTPLEVKKTEMDSQVRISDPEQLQKFLDEEENMLKDMVAQIKGTGANVVFCQKGIDDLAQHFLAKEGIFAVRRAKKSDMEKLAIATGGKVVTNLKEISVNDLGKAESVEEKRIGEDRMTFVTGCKNAKAVTILIRGGTEHVVDEIERNLNDALHVVSVSLQDGKYLAGGGATAMEITIKLRDFANKVSGREQMAVQAFADALEIIPKTLAENAGHDPVDALIKLRQQHAEGKIDIGLDAKAGKPKNMLKQNVIEPIRVGKQAVSSATDAAMMILRIDDVIASKKSAGPPPGAGGAGGMPPGMGGMGGMGGMPPGMM